MKIGFLGAGAMGGAILSGAIKAGVVKASDVYVSDHSQAIKDKYAALGCNICNENTDLAQADIVIFALKPQYAAPAIKSLGNCLDGKAVISIMAGIPLAELRELIESDVRILRIMPNTPALVNCGAFALITETDINDEEKAFAENLFGTMGIIEWVPEKLIDAVTGVSGSGPAYVYMFIEALADGGVMEGLPRDTAQKLAAQTVLGAAKMVLETGDHPGLLKDRVCSPGGTTIVGVKTLENGGFRGTTIDTVHAVCEKSKDMAKR